MIALGYFRRTYNNTERDVKLKQSQDTLDIWHTNRNCFSLQRSQVIPVSFSNTFTRGVARIFQRGGHTVSK